MRRISSLSFLLGTATLLAATSLTACSSSTEASPPNEVASSQPSATRLAAAEPIHVTKEDMNKTFNLTLEQMLIIDIDTPAGSDLFVSTDNSDAVSIDQAEGSGEITASPAVIAKAPGAALITVQAINDSEDQTPSTLLKFTVEVTTD